MDGVRNAAAAAPRGSDEIGEADSPITAARLGSDIGLAGTGRLSWHDDRTAGRRRHCQTSRLFMAAAQDLPLPLATLGTTCMCLTLAPGSSACSWCSGAPGSCWQQHWVSERVGEAQQTAPGFQGLPTPQHLNFARGLHMHLVHACADTCVPWPALTAKHTNRVHNQTHLGPSAPCFFSAAAVYAFLFAPNHLGLRHDLSLLSRAFYDNALTSVLFNLLGLFPFINNCLMWPALRSQGLQVRQCMPAES